jgi:hypothetical protein
MDFKGVLLEGITGVGKSTLFHRLQRHKRVLAYESRLFLSQSYTLRTAQTGKEQESLMGIVAMLEHLERQCASSEFGGRTDGRGSFCYVFEGFHYYMAIDRCPFEGQAPLIEAVENRLRHLGAQVILLHVSPESILQNCVKSTLRHRGRGWREFLAQYGSNEHEIAGHFERRQERLLELAKKSQLPVHYLDSASQDWDSLESMIEKAVWA